MNIKRVVQLTGLSPHTLRYYEKIGLLLDIGRSSNGHRDYSEKDLQWIEFIKRLKTTNMPLNEIKQFAELRSKGDCTINDRLKLLENHQRRVQNQIDAFLVHLQKIKEKMEICKQGGSNSRPENNA